MDSFGLLYYFFFSSSVIFFILFFLLFHDPASSLTRVLGDISSQTLDGMDAKPVEGSLAALRRVGPFFFFFVTTTVTSSLVNALVSLVIDSRIAKTPWYYHGP